MTELVRSTYSQCELCERGREEDSFCLLIKQNVDSRPIYFHAHKNEDFYAILAKLTALYPTVWKIDTQYYFYFDTGGTYTLIDDARWLRDRDVVIASPISELTDLPKVNLNAVHATLREDVELKKHQIEGVNRMIYMEKVYRGGILADEMGLGKTLQALTVILRQQPVLNTHACTLIVVPSRGIADQWANEIRAKTTNGSLPYILYEDETVGLLDYPYFRVAITTYDRVRAEFKNDEINRKIAHERADNAPLFEIDWARIVLDESHKVRGGTMLYHSVKALKAKVRWCLTGTPFQNDITELYPIFNFLNIEMDKKKKHEDDYMTELLKTHMIRRTKDSLKSDLPILPRQEKRVVLTFTKPEKALYDYLERLLYYQLKIIRGSSNGSFSSISSAILYLRLKQVCGHHMILLDKFPDLIPLANSGEENTLMNNLQTVDVQCERNYYDEASEFEQASEIIESYYDQYGDLHEPIDLSELQKLKFMKHSTKIIWLSNFLKQLLTSNTSDKVVVVSQFVDVILKISEVLTASRIPYETYHGSMSVYSRKIALQKFNHELKVRVLIMSLKAGGVGLNLQRANHMIIMDRWWNPATMDQAIARIHRITQLKETFIHTVVIKDSIEEGLMDNILDKKNALFEKVVGQHEQRKGKNRIPELSTFDPSLFEPIIPIKHVDTSLPSNKKGRS